MRAALVVVGLLTLLGCQTKPSENHRFQTLTTEQTGIDFTNTLTFNPAVNILEYLYYYNGGGVGVGDFNGDGWEDLYFTGNQVADQLYFNKGNMTFENGSQKAGISQAPVGQQGLVWMI